MSALDVGSGTKVNLYTMPPVPFGAVFVTRNSGETSTEGLLLQCLVETKHKREEHHE